MAHKFEWIKERPLVIEGPGNYFVACDNCGKTQSVSKSKLREKVCRNHRRAFCSKKCSDEFKRLYVLVDGKKRREVVCTFCQKEFLISVINVNRYKPSGSKYKHFCSPECKTKYGISINELAKMLDIVFK